MTQFISEPGFENGGAAWSLIGASQSVVTSDQHAGLASLQLGPGASALAIQTLPSGLLPGAVRFGCWAKRTAGTDAVLTLAISDDGGTPLPAISINPDGSTEFSPDSGATIESTGSVANVDEWFRITYKSSISGISGSAYLTLLRTSAGQPTANTWLVDDCSLAQGNAVITNAIRDAIVTDLGTVAGLNTVGTRPVRIDDADKPAAYVGRGDGADEVEGGAVCDRVANQSFDVKLYAHSSTSEDDLDDLIDDVRDALQVSTSSVSGVTGYLDVTCSWGQPTTDAGTNDGYAVATMTIDVRYSFRGGEA